MINSALIVPGEKPPSLLEIKRALVTYETVYLIDPSERDFIPPHTFFPSFLPADFPQFSVNIGAVKPLGKSIDYDVEFDKLYSQLRPAVMSGLIKVINLIDFPKQFAIGNHVPVGDYPLDYRFVHERFRELASKTELLQAAISTDWKSLIENEEYLRLISLEGNADILNGAGLEKLPNLKSANLDAEKAKLLSNVARARIANLIKCLGYCETKDMIPIFGIDYKKILSEVYNHTYNTLGMIYNELSISRYSVMLNVLHSEYLADEKLSELSVLDTLKLRSSTWNLQSTLRGKLLRELEEIQNEQQDLHKLEKYIKDLAEEYKFITSKLENERRDLKFKVKCEVTLCSMATAAALTSSQAFGQILQPHLPWLSIATILLSAGAWAAGKAREYVPIFRKVMEEQAKIEKGKGFAIHNYFNKLLP